MSTSMNVWSLNSNTKRGPKKMKQYLDIAKDGPDHVVLSNGDIIYGGLARTVFEGQWFFYRKVTKYASRLLVKTREEALEAYQLETGNCIV